jgi:hypothetical protein
MDIELNNQQEQAKTAVHVEPSLQPDQSSSGTTTQELEIDPPAYNLVSQMSNNPEYHPQLQQQQQPQNVAINVDARFGPSCATVLSDAEIVNNVIEASKREDRRRWLYLFYGCVPPFILMCLIWIIWAAIKCAPDSPDIFGDRCDPSTALYYFAIALGSLTGLILLWATCLGASRYTNGDRYDKLRSNVRFVVKLEGTKWTRYVDYLYGTNGGGFLYLGAIGGMSFCCRKSHYKKLIARGYGYIIFCQQGFILDEIYHIVRNEPHFILKVVYIMGTGLRVYVVRSDGTYTVHRSWSEETRRAAGLNAINQQTVPLDIYLPDTLPERSVILLALQVQHGL